MKTTRFIVNPFQVNMYVLSNNNECLLIDPACYYQEEFDNLLDYIEAENIKPIGILNTHGHLDHVCGNNKLRDYFNIPVYMNKDDEFLLESALEFAGNYGFSMEQPIMPSKNLEEGDKISIGGQEIIMIPVPGHSPGSIAVYNPIDAFVVTGDALFAQSIGRTDLPKGNHETLIKNISENLFTLPAHTTVFPGHGSDTNIASEIANNPFFK